MKAVILAGGLGTRLSEYTSAVPKPMVEVGNKPIILHIMDLYAAHGVNDFIILAGYKGEVIKQFFGGLRDRVDDFTINLKTGTKVFHSSDARPWNVTILDTGLETLTGGRLRRAQQIIGDDPFFLTYGDGLASVDISRLLSFHKSHGAIATLTAVRPVARFGEVRVEGDRVSHFAEKPQLDSGWINGGFFVFQNEIFKYLTGDDTVLESSPLEALAKAGELAAYKHEGFWQCMDTKRDKDYLELLWKNRPAPWELSSD